jgi:hypothetical protein
LTKTKNWRRERKAKWIGASWSEQGEEPGMKRKNRKLKKVIRKRKIQKMSERRHLIKVEIRKMRKMKMTKKVQMMRMKAIQKKKMIRQ